MGLSHAERNRRKRVRKKKAERKTREDEEVDSNNLNGIPIQVEFYEKEQPSSSSGRLEVTTRHFFRAILAVAAGISIVWLFHSSGILESSALVVCGPAPPPPPEPKCPAIPNETKRKGRFLSSWKKKKPTPPVVTENEPSLKPPFARRICQVAWSMLQSPESQSSQPPVCPTLEESRPKNIFSRLVHRRRRSKPTKETSTTSIATLRSQIPSAFSQEWQWTSSQKKVAAQVATRFRNELLELHTHHHHEVEEHLQKVSWGGPGGPHWWHPSAAGNPQVDGSTLLSAYLRIMQFPTSLETHFPFSHCSHQAPCSADFALMHSYQWRELYKPWCMPPSAMQENKEGFVYVRGYSPSLDASHNGGNSMVWFRMGIHSCRSSEMYFRSVLYSLERAVAESFARNPGKIGKFNVLVDAQGAHYHMLPALKEFKQFIAMMQDHFPDRLGMILLVNLTRVAEFVVGLTKPLITKEVRDKIYILPHDADKRLAMLEAAVETKFIPDFLGGTDTYRFDPDTYFPQDKRHECTDEEALAYLDSYFSKHKD